MPKQRVRERPSVLLIAGRAVTLILALALIWYGVMLILLAFKVSPSTVNSISGYRTAWRWLSGLDVASVSGSTTRPILAGAGVAAFIIFGWLALKSLPRPYLARRDMPLAADNQGEVVVEPRAVERLAEVAVEGEPGVSDARGRYSVDGLNVDVAVRRAGDVAQTLTDAQERVAQALAQHQLPTMPVNITLTGYDGRRRRELD